jgi:hypothetical protein
MQTESQRGPTPVVRYRTDKIFGIAYKPMAEKAGVAERAP